MIELLRRVATEDPGRAAIVTHERTVGYAELLASAERAAEAIRREGVTRFAVVDHEAAPVAALLAAGAATGAQVCLYPPG